MHLFGACLKRANYTPDHSLYNQVSLNFRLNIRYQIRGITTFAD